MKELDVIVIGGGPAGSAVGNYLARAGKRVRILEAESFPRHHIGESLLPASMPLLAELGLSAMEMATRFQPKRGARFYDSDSDQIVTFSFERLYQPHAALNGAPKNLPPTFQIWRAEFDELLLNLAKRAGCEIIQGETAAGSGKVVSVHWKPGAGGTVTCADGNDHTARFLVDATGQASLLAGKRGPATRQMIPSLGRIAVYNYFTQLPPHDSHDSDYITMYVFNGGWFWMIPLRDGRTSIGVVVTKAWLVGPGKGRVREEIFNCAVELNPRLAARLKTARITDTWRLASDYSYHALKKTGPGWLLVGDAGGFLDPIFSSGVHLALSSAKAAAAAILGHLNGEAAALANYEAHTRKGFEVFLAFVHRFYNRDLVRNLFFTPNKPKEMEEAIVRVLAGEVWDLDNPVVRMVMGSQVTAKFADTLSSG